jgi:hypothetical protein
MDRSSKVRVDSRQAKEKHMPLTPERDDGDSAEDEDHEGADVGPEDFVQKNPLTACALAALTGFVLARVLF